MQYKYIIQYHLILICYQNEHYPIPSDSELLPKCTKEERRLWNKQVIPFRLNSAKSNLYKNKILRQTPEDLENVRVMKKNNKHISLL